MISLADVGRRGFSAPDRRPIYRWAAEFVTMPAVLTVGGKFNPDISRHFLEIFEALQNDHVRVVTLLKPVRGGGSLVGDIWTIWQTANDPGAMMANFQTDADARDFSKDRLGQMLRGCEPVAAILSEDNIQEKKFAHGLPLYIQGPSLGNFQAKGVRYLRNEEIWMWEPGRYQQALARVGDWKKLGMSKIFNISQGGIEKDELDREFTKGDQREWHVPCMKCGKHFPAEISGRRADGSIWGLRWDENEKTRDRYRDWIIAAVRKKVWYECPRTRCRHKHTDEIQTKEHWNRNGKWVVTNPAAPAENVSFHFTAVISDTWPDLADEFCSAMNALHVGVLEPLIAYTQKKEARPWSEQRLYKQKAAPTFQPGPEDWKDEAMRFFTLDCQAEGVFWGMIRAWSKRGESRRLWFGKIHSEAEIQKIQAEFKVQANRVFLDSGAFTRVVYGMCCRHGWISLKGEDKKQFVHSWTERGKPIQVLRSYSDLRRGDPEAGELGQGQRFAKLILWSNPTIKDRLQRQMDLGLWLEPEVKAEDPDEAEYSRQMRAEYRREKKDPETGRVEQIWVCPSGNNHLRDCACEQVVAATLAKLLPDFQKDPSV